VNTFTTSKGESFQSPFTFAQALEICASLPNSFAQDLVAKSKRYGLSPAQEVWVHKLAVDSTTPKTTVKENFANIVAMFRNTTGKLKYPKVTIQVGDQNVVLKYKKDGSVQIVDKNVYKFNAKFGQEMPVWYGKIDSDGNFIKGSNLDSITEVLKEFNLNPSDYARTYGTRTGNCCFCGKTLETNQSLAAGYGPVCADHYGLPWG
jgi:Family of unknown function (DUF6011)